MSLKMRINPLDYPSDITYEILSRIPVESALQCKRVSRTWRDFFAHIKEGMIFAIGVRNKEKPCFRLYYADNDMIKNNIKERRTYSKLLKDFHHPPIESRDTNPISIGMPMPYHMCLHVNYKNVIVGSRNGLVCFTIPNGVLDDPVYICNPFTRESVNLPRLASVGQFGLVVSGFGFDLRDQQYKVVRIYYPDRNFVVGHVEVYTLGAGSGWRNGGEVTYSLCSSPGVLVDGVLHWIDDKTMQIVGFCLKDEKFLLLPSPPCLHAPNNFYQRCQPADFRLKKLRGCLSIVHHRRRGEDRCADIWFYTKDYSTSCSSYNMNIELSYDIRYWSLEIKMNTTLGCLSKDDYDPFLVTEENKVLFWYNKSNLLCFDPETSTTTWIVRDFQLCCKYFSATPHVNTRVSLKNLEKENCVVQEWDEEELDKPIKKQAEVLPLPRRVEQPATGALPYVNILASKKIAIPLGVGITSFIWCQYLGITSLYIFVFYIAPISYLVLHNLI